MEGGQRMKARGESGTERQGKGVIGAKVAFQPPTYLSALFTRSSFFGMQMVICF